jgi:hypothetical protein
MVEEELFYKLKKIIPDLKRTSKYDYKDCHSEEFDLVIEIKCRTGYFPSAMIEYEKYVKLLKHPRCRYVVSEDDLIFSFDLQKIPEPEWRWQLLPKTTEFENTTKILKKVGFLPYHLAKKLDI